MKPVASIILLFLAHLNNLLEKKSNVALFGVHRFCSFYEALGWRVGRNSKAI